ncbi:putative glutamine amidotransferase DUG3 [Grifola frondosa]|uniref:Putative glutamine amidotransferase DUG3 n=1 Tax=Grifola frondosa TaxID=5627 RepID=A0A1C7MSJ5_GRIFR|nr:putative glutamine amidotransferase DUG3 [Grifola frondosa]
MVNPSLLNFCVTDGESVVATRYISSDKTRLLLYEYAEGGHYKMSKTDKRESIIMVASEPLTFEKADWMEIRTNHMVYYVPPSDPASLNRGTEFASARGLLSPRDRNPRSQDPENCLPLLYEQILSSPPFTML